MSIFSKTSKTLILDELLFLLQHPQEDEPVWMHTLRGGCPLMLQPNSVSEKLCLSAIMELCLSVYDVMLDLTFCLFMLLLRIFLFV